MENSKCKAENCSQPALVLESIDSEGLCEHHLTRSQQYPVVVGPCGGGRRQAVECDRCGKKTIEYHMVDEQEFSLDGIVICEECVDQANVERKLAEQQAHIIKIVEDH